MRILLSLLIVCFFCAGAVQAQQMDATLAVEESVPIHDRVIEVAALSDAMNMACEKETQLTLGYLQRFIKAGIEAEEIARLEILGVAVFEGKIRKIMEEKKPCNDVDFLLERFTAMKELRSLSYTLAGIDPASVPSSVDFSDIEKLMGEAAGVAELPIEAPPSAQPEE